MIDLNLLTPDLPEIGATGGTRDPAVREKWDAEAKAAGLDDIADTPDSALATNQIAPTNQTSPSPTDGTLSTLAGGATGTTTISEAWVDAKVHAIGPEGPLDVDAIPEDIESVVVDEIELSADTGAFADDDLEDGVDAQIASALAVDDESDGDAEMKALDADADLEEQLLEAELAETGADKTELSAPDLEGVSDASDFTPDLAGSIDVTRPETTSRPEAMNGATGAGEFATEVDAPSIIESAASEALRLRAEGILDAEEAVTIGADELGGDIDIRLRSVLDGVSLVLSPHRGEQLTKLAGSLTTIESMLRQRGIRARRISLDESRVDDGESTERGDHAQLSAQARQRVEHIAAKQGGRS